MANRTVRILGQGYGNNPAEITVTANGNTVFSGSISTLNEPVPALPNFALSNSMVTLCSFETDQAFTGQIPMICQVTQGSAIFAQIYANYVRILNPVYSTEQYSIITNSATTNAERTVIWTELANPPLSQPEIETLATADIGQTQTATILAAHNLSYTVSSGADTFGPIANAEPRSNVVINGVAQTTDPGELPGAWFWIVNSGSTLAYDLEVDPAVV
jgi:hypothetical protein